MPKFKETSFTASIDNINQYAEYLRRRSNLKEIEENIDLLLNSDKYKGTFVDVNSVITCFSVLRFDEVIKYCRIILNIRSGRLF